jgi:tetratricopeptide (TPR) repeat protein
MIYSKLWWIATVLMVFAASGCTYVQNSSSTSLVKIEQLIEQKRYGQAQAILSQIPETEPDYSVVVDLQKRARTQASAYEKLTLKEGKELERRREWHLAMQRYQLGLKNLLHSAKISAAQEALQNKIDTRVAEVEFDLLMARGEWLIRQLSYQTQLSRLLPEHWLAGFRQDGVKRDARHVAEELGSFGRRAMEQDNFSLADQIFQLSLQLHPDAEIEATRKALGTRKRQAVAKDEKDTRKGLSNSLQRAMTEERLGEASRLANQIEAQGKLNDQELEIIQKLGQIIHQQVNENIELGVAHYSQGNYLHAISAWQEVLALEPNNSEATAHIARAERVLKKLERLRQNN